MGSSFDLKFGRVCRGKLSREGQRRVCQIYTEDPDPLIPEYPKILSIPDPAPKALVQNEYFQAGTHLTKDIVRELDAILLLTVIGDDCLSATWVMDAKHGEGTISLLNGPGLDK